MKAQCVICAERFLQSSIISATLCGHLFHDVCLLQWNEQSKTCPQCRTKLGPKSIVYKLYLEAGEADGNESFDAEFLEVMRNSNNELQAQQSELKSEITNLRAVVELRDMKLEYYKREIEKLTTTSKQASDKAAYRKVQLGFLKMENERLVASEHKLESAKKELATYSTLQSMLNASSAETEKILKSYSSDPNSLKQLATYCSLLQKELNDARNSKAKMKVELKILKRDLAEAHGGSSNKDLKIAKLSAENISLKESLDFADRELESTNKKMERLHKKMQDKTNSNNTTFDRIILESPAPQQPNLSRERIMDSPMRLEVNLLKRRTNDCVDAHLNQNKIAKKIPTTRKLLDKTIVLDSSSSSSSEDLCQGFSIFKRNRRPPASSSHSASSTSLFTGSTKNRGYDGFGGHSKPEVFPAGGGAIRKVPTTKKGVGKKTSFKSHASKSTMNIDDYLIDLSDDES